MSDRDTIAKIVVKTCPICGKRFVPAPMHIYHVDTNGTRKYMCSYSCWKEAKRRKSVGYRSYTSIKRGER